MVDSWQASYQLYLWIPSLERMCLGRTTSHCLLWADEIIRSKVSRQMRSKMGRWKSRWDREAEMTTLRKIQIIQTTWRNLCDELWRLILKMHKLIWNLRVTKKKIKEKEIQNDFVFGHWCSYWATINSVFVFVLFLFLLLLCLIFFEELIVKWAEWLVIDCERKKKLLSAFLCLKFGSPIRESPWSAVRLLISFGISVFCFRTFSLKMKHKSIVIMIKQLVSSFSDDYIINSCFGKNCFVLFCFVLFCFLFCFVFVLFCFVLFCFVLFCFVLFCFVLFCFVLFCFVLFCFVLFCFVLFCFVLFCFVLFCFVLFCFVLFCFVLFCFVLFCFVLFCFVLFCFVLFCFVLFCFVLFCFVLFCFVLFCFVYFRFENESQTIAFVIKELVSLFSHNSIYVLDAPTQPTIYRHMQWDILIKLTTCS